MNTNWGAGSIIVAIVIWLSLHWVSMYHNKRVYFTRKIVRFPKNIPREIMDVEKAAAKRWRTARHHSKQAS